MSRPVRVVVGILIILPVLAHLVYAAWVSPLTNYYLTVDEFLASPVLTQDAVRVAGRIVPGSIGRGEFQIRSERSTLKVAYHGLLPDTFQPGLTAILEGQLVEGIFRADTVIIKCPHEFLAVS